MQAGHRLDEGENQLGADTEGPSLAHRNAHLDRGATLPKTFPPDPLQAG